MTNQVVTQSTLYSYDSEQSRFQYELINQQNYSQEMPGIWQFVAANLAAQGDVEIADALTAAKSEHFDPHPETRVIKIFGQDRRMVGTFSVTMDSDRGMPVTHYFADELAFLRKKYRMVNGWRFSMLPIPDAALLRNRTFAIFKSLAMQDQADAIVLYFNERLNRYYSRFFNGRVIATKTISFDGINELPVSLFVGEVKDNQPEMKYLLEGTNA
ncbi:N-acyl amino acid synthase FeeM domain-containing protein [Reinekea marinisedimentorum]|uniref:N-acyl amino acid synthase FeeM catalytic core domain-containing protein n=1 Tax=Reinekea marinisedimentorum TaxID=230495 RepID=A0A4R3I9L1_9GAMM|nr:hypothetical protein [Reinekea marinisedimentorum]TCS43089.1 hypothetical protein BCF53_102112 [Reinekea marinisedimentorum]